MKEQIIKIETARMAKEKGFTNPCMYFYSEDDETKKQLYTYHRLMTFNDEELKIEAPSQSLLQRWLREEHKIMVYLSRYDDGIYPPRWSIYIYIDRSKHIYINGSENYEDGLEEGLLEGLKLIK